MKNSQQVPPLHTISRVAKKLSRHERAWLGTCSGNAFRSGWHISRGLQILFLRTFSTSTSRSMRLATSDASFPLVLGLWVFLWSAVVIFGEVCQFIERKRKKKYIPTCDDRGLYPGNWTVEQLSERSQNIPSIHVRLFDTKSSSRLRRTETYHHFSHPDLKIEGQGRLSA